jgi:HemY protein
MARLEEGPGGDAASARRWLMSASSADPDPAWQCKRCGTIANGWRANCGHCHAFDSLAWQAPHRQAALPHIVAPTAGALPAPGTSSATPAHPVVADQHGPATALATATQTEPLPAPVDAARLVN